MADHQERVTWRRALERTREAWGRCYDRQPAEKVERQLSLIREDRDRPDTRECLECGTSIEHKHPQAKFCSDQHRRDFNHARVPMKMKAAA